MIYHHYILWVIFVVQSVLLAFAAWRDVASRIIPDRISILLALTGAATQLLIDPWRLVISLIVAFVLFLPLLYLHGRYVLGGADVKLLVALSIGLPPMGVVTLFQVTALTGGVLAIAYLLLRRASRPILAKSNPSLMRRVYAVERWRILRHAPLPYGVAIACGGMWALLTNSVWG